MIAKQRADEISVAADQHYQKYFHRSMSAFQSEQTFNFHAQCRRVDGADGVFHSHDVIACCQFVFAGAEHFADQALEFAPVHGTRNEPLPDDYSKARPNRAGSTKYLEMSSGGNRSSPQRCGKVRCFVEPQIAAKPEPGRRLIHTLRLWRPFARRARITERPPRVFMRTRKPCVLLRRTTDG